MNDKCAGGTGVVIEKIAAKLHLSREDLHSESYEDAQSIQLPANAASSPKPISPACKSRASPIRLMASLFQAIVLQNLSVLTRGNTLMPNVFLLGGPNAYFPGLQSAWRKGLLDLWKRKKSSCRMAPSDTLCSSAHGGVFRCNRRHRIRGD